MAMALTWCRYAHHRHTGLKTLLKSRNCIRPLLLKDGYGTAVFYERNKKGTEEDPKKRPKREALKLALKNFGPELKLFYEEQKDMYTRNPMVQAEHGNYEVIYKFNDQESVKSWLCTADSDTQAGFSSAQFTFSKNRTGLFHGYLNKSVPKDGKTKYSGFANISSPRCKKSFNRDTHMDWSLFNCILLRVRGDGRPYNVVVGCDFKFDVNWLNRWSYPLFTRGGPYWQIAKIPFSKFFISHSGRIQDSQEPLPLMKVNSLGITVLDQAEGTFCLEIDSIALMYDINLSGKHAYELYQNKWYEVQS